MEISVDIDKDLPQTERDILFKELYFYRGDVSASMIVNEAGKYKSEIVFIKDEKEYNGKSIIGVLSMGAAKGDTLIIQAKGEDQEEAVLGLKDLILHGLKD